MGAGDAHCAGVLAGLARGWSLAQAVDLGNRLAAWSVSQPGNSSSPDWQKLYAMSIHGSLI